MTSLCPINLYRMLLLSSFPCLSCDTPRRHRSLHHALLSKRIQVLREKLTELDRKKQELRIDSSRETQTQEELESQRENLQRAVDDLHADMQALENEKQQLIQEETQQIEAEANQKMLVDRLLKDIEGTKKEVTAKNATMAENEKAVKSLEVRMLGYVIIAA